MVSTLESSKGLAEKNAYILPSLVDFQSKKLRLFFLPDGNERAKRQSSLGYGDGGKNVVKVIQSLAERGDVEEVVFAILSHENIVGRGEAFFHELYLAFMGLGIAIDRKGDLVKSGVRLEIAGDLNLLKRTNQSTRLLADMIEAVVNRTHLGKEPKLIVKFGIDYEVDTLIKEGTDIVFRTGMESPNTFRSSGLNISNNMLCIGSDVLWPKLDPNFVSDQIDRVKKGGHRFLENGHSTMVAARIIEKIKPIHGCNIDMPIDTDYNSMIRAIELLVDQNRELLQYLGVLVVDRTGNIRRIGKSNVDFNISLFEAAENNPGRFRRSYDFMVAPGQTGSDFILPANPFIDYATVFGCKDTPEDIIGTVILAIDNLKVNPPLFGTQRPYSINETSNGFDEFNFYESLADVIEVNDSAIENIARSMTGKEDLADFDVFMKTCDLFVARFMRQAEKRKVRFDTEIQKRALINYVYTSVFMTYCPNKSDWMDYSIGWEKRAEGLALYMEAVFYIDEVFAFVIPDGLSLEEVYLIKEIFSASIRGQKISYKKTNSSRIDDYVYSAINAIELANQLFSQESDDEILSLWRNRFVNLVDNNVAEIVRTINKVSLKNGPLFNDKLVKSAVDNLDEALQDSSRQGALSEVISVIMSEGLDINRESDDLDYKISTVDSRYRHPFIPNLLKEKIRHSINRLPDQNSRVDLDYWFYLTDIGNSIGSDLTYRSIACVGSKGVEISKEFKDCFEQLCFSVNVFFRIANDLADVNRPQSDRDNTCDSYEILAAKYKDLSQSERTIKIAIDLMDLLEEVMPEILRLANHLKELSQGNKLCTIVALSVIRSQIGALFYAGTHYRMVKYNTLVGFFRKMYDLGT